MKVLVANIAMGNPRSDRLLPVIRSLSWFHNWRIIPFLVSGGRFENIFDYGSYVRTGRVEYFIKNSDLNKITGLLVEENPDVVIINEVLRQVHYKELLSVFEKFGYSHVVAGWSIHHPDATLGTMIASKMKVSESSFLDLPWGGKIGGGGGAAYIFISDLNTTFIGCHLAIGKCMEQMFNAEIDALVKFSLGEMRKGRRVIIGGDFNAIESKIQKTAEFEVLGLKTVTEINTNPTCLPALFRTACDHIFIPTKLSARTKYLSFGSDHLAVLADLVV